MQGHDEVSGRADVQVDRFGRVLSWSYVGKADGRSMAELDGIAGRALRQEARRVRRAVPAVARTRRAPRSHRPRRSSALRSASSRSRGDPSSSDEEGEPDLATAGWRRRAVARALAHESRRAA
jgi:hypothetical protein